MTSLPSPVVAQMFQRLKPMRYPNLEMRYNSRQEKGVRLAVIVPKKVASKAHDRNKIKRWLRDIVAVYSVQHQSNSYDLVIKVSDLGSYPQYKDQIVRFLERSIN